MKINIKNTSNNPMPSYATKGSAGLDLRANIPNKTIVIKHGTIVKIPTGIHLELPEGFEAQIRGRSGLTSRGIDAKLGTIDSDYRGEISITIQNSSGEDFIINHGDRIAQMVINQYTRVEPVQVETLSDTERGDGGFGHTGIK
jgi:dUTP pyrophosphatase